MIPILEIPNSDCTRLITGLGFPSPESPYFTVHLHDNHNAVAVRWLDASEPEIVFQQGDGLRRLNYLELSRKKHPNLQFFALPLPITDVGADFNEGTSPVAVLMLEPNTGVVHELGTTISRYALAAAGLAESVEAAQATCDNVARLAYKWVESVNALWGNFSPRRIGDIQWDIESGELRIDFDEPTEPCPRGADRFIFNANTLKGQFILGKESLTSLGWDKTVGRKPRLNAFYGDLGVSPLHVKMNDESSAEPLIQWPDTELSCYQKGELFVPIGLCLTLPDASEPRLVYLGTTTSPYHSQRSPDDCSRMAVKALDIAAAFNQFVSEPSKTARGYGIKGCEAPGAREMFAATRRSNLEWIHTP